MYLLFTLRQGRHWTLPLLTLAVLVTSLYRGWPAVTTATAPQQGVPVPIVMYHSLLPGGNSTYVIDPDLLEQDLQYLRDNGYTTVTVGDLIAHVDDGTPLPDKPVMLTFDDGCYNNYLYAHPLLQQYGMQAVVSPIVSVSEFYSDNPGQQNHPRYSNLTWDQLAEMVESGVWEIGHHSYDLHHTDRGRKGVAQKKGESDTAYEKMLTDDLTTATGLLKDRVGVTPTAFVYPFGAYTSRTDPILRQMGFRVTLTCEERVNRITQNPDSLWRLGRFLRPPDVDSATYFEPLFRKTEG